MKKIFALLLILTGLFSYAQKNYTLSGYIKDQKTGEVLIGAIVIIKEMPETGAATNGYGFFSITVPEGEYFVSMKMVGYETKVEKISMKQDIKRDFILEEKNTTLSEFVVSDERTNSNITSTQMGMDKINIKDIQAIPVLFGEKDILKTIQLLPGIKPVGEGNAGFYVRGGAADQNLILLDEAVVYNASHLLGFFSVFNSDAIKDVTVYKGEMPAEYGGRLSSVLDIKMNDGNEKMLGVSGGIGLIDSRLNIEGPIVKDQGSFMISGRRTYADLFLKLSSDTNLRKAVLYFYDLNAKANYRLNENNRIYLSGYFGKDVLGFGQTFGTDWGNATGTLRWNHLFNNKLFSNTSLIYSNYNYAIQRGSGTTGLNISSRIEDYNFKQDFEYFINSNNELKLGLNSIYHTIVPGIITSTDPTQTTTISFPFKYAMDNAIYITDNMKVSKRMSFNYGFRYTSFSPFGPGSFYTYDAIGNPVDSVTYNSVRWLHTYFNFEPRITTNFIINEKSSVKAAYGRNTQNMHLLSNTTSENPSDLWVPSSLNIKPEVSDQFSIGYFRNFKDNMYEFSAETYYKTMTNQIDYRDGAQIRLNQDVESQLLYGTGRAYGLELFLKKKYGRLNGWIGYTLSRSEKQINGINNDMWYPAKQDRTHDISVVGVYELNKKWTVSATWVYYTGNAVTFPSGKYEIMGRVINYYTERNGYRMPAYHRLDLGATMIAKKTAKFESSWTFSIYNAYGRENAYSISFGPDPNDPNRTVATQTSLFRFVPSVTYNFKF